MLCFDIINSVFLFSLFVRLFFVVVVVAAAAAAAAAAAVVVVVVVFEGFVSFMCSGPSEL